MLYEPKISYPRFIWVMVNVLKIFIATSVCAITAAAAEPAAAALTIYTSQSAFFSAISDAGTDSFDSLNIRTYDSPWSRTSGSYDYTVSDGLALYGAGSSSDGWLTNYSSDHVITFDGFAPGVSAIGGDFFGTDAAGGFKVATLGIRVTATDADGSVTQDFFSPATTNYFGVTSTGGLSSLTVQALVPSVGYWATINNLTLAQAKAVAPVPEPATWATMAIGFALAGSILRRRQRTVAFA